MATEYKDGLRVLTDKEYDEAREAFAYRWRGKDRKHLKKYPPDSTFNDYAKLRGYYHKNMDKEEIK